MDKGLCVFSQHARGLGYDALLLFLDELILWTPTGPRWDDGVSCTPLSRAQTGAALARLLGRRSVDRQRMRARDDGGRLADLHRPVENAGCPARTGQRPKAPVVCLCVLQKDMELTAR